MELRLPYVYLSRSLDILYTIETPKKNCTHTLLQVNLISNRHISINPLTPTPIRPIPSDYPPQQPSPDSHPFQNTTICKILLQYASIKKLLGQFGI